MELEPETIRYALDVAAVRGYGRLKLRVGESEFSAVLSPRSLAIEEDQREARSEEGPPGTTQVLAPVVGFIAEGEVPWEPGAELEAGELIAEVLALGIASEVRAEGDGRVVEWHVQPGATVEYGQPIATLEGGAR